MPSRKVRPRPAFFTQSTSARFWLFATRTPYLFMSLMQPCWSLVCGAAPATHGAANTPARHSTAHGQARRDPLISAPSLLVRTPVYRVYERASMRQGEIACLGTESTDRPGPAGDSDRRWRDSAPFGRARERHARVGAMR